MVLVVESGASEIYHSDAVALGLVKGLVICGALSEGFFLEEDVLGFEVGVSVTQLM